MRDLDGRVLEIGVGAGPNLPHYRHATAVWAIEPVLTRAAWRGKRPPRRGCPSTSRWPWPKICRLPPPLRPYRVDPGLLFGDGSAPGVGGDATRPEAGRYAPHGGACPPETPVLAWLFGVVTPTWSRFAHNCHLDRPRWMCSAARAGKSPCSQPACLCNCGPQLVHEASLYTSARKPRHTLP